eukprot:6351581-Pyramimonas_sp.AAC.1
MALPRDRKRKRNRNATENRNVTRNATQHKRDRKQKRDRNATENRNLRTRWGRGSDAPLASSVLLWRRLHPGLGIGVVVSPGGSTGARVDGGA